MASHSSGGIRKAVSPKKRPLKSKSDTGFIIGGGDMGDMIRRKDWSQTPLGSLETWPEYIPVSLNIILNSSVPSCIWLGKDEMVSLYNDAFKDTLGDLHPAALGKSAPEVLGDHWADLGPLVMKVFKSRKPIYHKDVKFKVNRYGYEEETYFSFSYSPIYDLEGSVAGLYCSITDTTEVILRHQELKESEARFRNLADTAPMYIAMADKNGNAVYFNKPWLQFTGKKLKEMLGLGWLSTLHPQDAPKFEKDFKHAFKLHIPINEEYRFKRADGEYRWMYAVGAPRFTPDGHFIGYFGTYTDFHELKIAQLALKESEIRFRTLIERSADAVQLVSPEGEILFTSDSIKNVLGYTPEELAHEGIEPYLHPDDREYFFKIFNDLVRNPDKQVTMQYRVKHKDGSWAWLETVGVNHLQTPYIHAMVGNFRNITMQKEAEVRVKDSEQRFRALADNIPNLAWMAEASGYIFWFNSRWYSYTGTTLEQMEGWGWQSVHDPDYLSHVLKDWKHSIRSGQTFEMVFPLKGSDGIYRPFLTRAVPLRSENGRIIQWIGTCTDISEQLKVKEAQARNEELEQVTSQLALQRQELIELNRAKDEFISLASHQLRTPATGVKQYLGMLLEGYGGELSPQQKMFAARSYESNERQITIINDLLKVAQVDSGKMKLKRRKFDFVAFIQEVLDEQKDKFKERKQTVSFKHTEPALMAHADKERLRMALENLIDNASKYTPANKKISVRLSRKNQKTVQIEVKDQGVGMASKDITKIFDKFVRVDNNLSEIVGGSGLGLYLVQKIVNLHGGTIGVSSVLGKGSVFTLLLPE